MALSLHAAVIPGFIRMLGTLDHLIGKAEAWAADNGKTEEDICEARLAPDMLGLAYQVQSCVVHSVKSLDGIRAGVFSPDRSEPPATFAALRQMIAEARETLGALSEQDIEELGQASMEFRIGDKLAVPFTGQDFLLTFSQPNFYFHHTTAYDILRHIGVGIGKRDYLGPDWSRR